MSLIARHLEANGISSVVLGSALDIVEHCGVARFAFVDFPLGNPCGKPYDRVQQRRIVESALALLETAVEARTTRRLPYRWSADETWRDRYMAFGAEDLPELRWQGEQRKARRRALRDAGRE